MKLTLLKSIQNKFPFQVGGRKHQIFLSALIILTFSGCVVFPTSRTYFEPNPDDGQMTKSVSCGYHRTALNTLEREIDGVKITVTPYFKENEIFTLGITFRGHYDNNSFNPDDFILLDLESDKQYYLQNVNRTLQKPRDNWPYFVHRFNLSYPIGSNEISKIAIQLLTNSVVINGNNVKIKPFRFNKVTKSDIYYASINC